MRIDDGGCTATPTWTIHQCRSYSTGLSTKGDASETTFMNLLKERMKKRKKELERKKGKKNEKRKDRRQKI